MDENYFWNGSETGYKRYYYTEDTATVNKNRNFHILFQENKKAIKC